MFNQYDLFPQESLSIRMQFYIAFILVSLFLKNKQKTKQNNNNNNNQENNTYTHRSPIKRQDAPKRNIDGRLKSACGLFQSPIHDVM